MEPIATAWQDRTFTYTQIERQGMYAIYAQTHKEGGQTRFEVIRIRVRAEHTWPNGNTTPEHEGYPGPSTWGVDGFTHATLEDAQQHLAHLLQHPAGEQAP
jgi:hypothetical protein